MITDRTQADVESVTKNQTSVNKGAYNYTDLNRVENKVKELNELLQSYNYISETLTTKLDWSYSDKFNVSDMQRYLENIQKIRNAFNTLPSTPLVPTTMNYMNYETANNIEKILVDIEMLISGMANYFVYSGVANAGQRRLYQNRFRHFHPHALQSTGTQYIDTGIKAQVGIKVEMEFSFTNFGVPFGCHYNSPNMSFFTIGTPLRWSMVTNGAQVTSSNETPLINTNYKAEFYVGGNEQYLKINGENLISNTLTITGTNAYNLYLFKRNSSSSPDPASMKLYYCKIWVGDTLVRDFVPTLTNDIPCLYDNVTQTSFYNAGTGDFIYN